MGVRVGQKEKCKMEDVRYFFDSYAVIELLKENPSYARFKDEQITITVFSLAEIYWCFLLEDENTAEKVYEKFKKSVILFGDEILKEAMKFRKQNKKQNLSYADCIGYTYALKHKIIFLTGDKEFSGFKNVEFVK